MKGYIRPHQFTPNVCFICGEPCLEGTYAHSYCAIAYSDEKDRKIKQANEEETR